MASLLETVHNPDVLTCLANLSNDEVFTPPDLANDVLDMLPAEIWSDPTIKILDPCCKSGVFLREAAKRFIVGLEGVYPDLNERVDHIMHEQLFGIAITELTSLLSRRSLYCSKFPNGKFSVVEFDSSEGRIRHRSIQHTWVNDRCKYCGASNAKYDRDEALETHAYEFIHTDNPERILNMKFDVIVGNPPYQLSDGGGSGTSAKPIYHLFIQQCMKLNPRYMTMITPSRWFSGGKGLDEFRVTMLEDSRLSEIHDFIEASDCFPGVQIKGGVSYFLWNRSPQAACKVYTHQNGKVISSATRPIVEPGCDIFIRFNEGVEIYRKVASKKESSIETIVSSRRPYGLASKYRGHSVKHEGDSLVYQNGGTAFVSPDEYSDSLETAEQWKVFIPFLGSGSDKFPHNILGTPFVGSPGSVCTETYLTIGPLESKTQAENLMSYIATRFFRFLVLLRKPSQNATRNVYGFVPLQDFSKPWTDEELYAKYGLSEKEIKFIESMVRPMDLGDSNE
jgi:site-specific DNA-methyltransferase (adenine-specific)